MSCDNQGSTIKSDKISACLDIRVKAIEAAADTPSYSKWMPELGAQDYAFVLSNATGAGGVVTSFQSQAVGGQDVNGNTLQLDAAGELVTTDSIDPVTGLGTPVPESDLELCLVKERLVQCSPTKAVDGMLPNDTGQAGNQYVLEYRGQEIGYQSQEQAGKKPCFVRICVVATADETFCLACIAMGLPFANPPVTKEVLA